MFCSQVCHDIEVLDAFLDFLLVQTKVYIDSELITKSWKFYCWSIIIYASYSSRLAIINSKLAVNIYLTIVTVCMIY
jgi:hypothetical protein